MSESSFETELSDQELAHVLTQGAMQPSAEEQARFWQDLEGRLEQADKSESETVNDDSPMRSLPPLVEPESLSPAQSRKIFALRPAFLSVAAAVVVVLIALPVMKQGDQSPQTSESSVSLDQLESELGRVDSQPMTLGAAPPAEEPLSAADQKTVSRPAADPDQAALKDSEQEKQSVPLRKSRNESVKPSAKTPAVKPVANAPKNKLSERKAEQADQLKQSVSPEQLAKEADAAKKLAQEAKAEAVAQRWAELKKILADLPVTVKPLNATQAELQVSQEQAAALEARLSAWSVPSALSHKFFRADQVTYLLEISGRP